MKTRDVEKLYQENVLPTYTKTPVCFVKGKGLKLWDIEGREYLDFFAGWAVKISLSSIILSTTFSLGVGIVFGLWPARQASRLNPIEARRYE